MGTEDAIKALISNEFNAETLSTKSEPIKEIDDEIRELASILARTLNFTTGLGIAAPQIGIYKRIFAYKTLVDGIKVIINPEIIDQNGTQSVKEGCLSLPHIFGMVDRPKKVVVKGLNLKGEEIIIKAEDQLASVFMHEIEHLDGGIFIKKIKGKIEDPYDLLRLYYASKNMLQKKSRINVEAERE